MVIISWEDHRKTKGKWWFNMVEWDWYRIYPPVIKHGVLENEP